MENMLLMGLNGKLIGIFIDGPREEESGEFFDHQLRIELLNPFPAVLIQAVYQLINYCIKYFVFLYYKLLSRLFQL